MPRRRLPISERAGWTMQRYNLNGMSFFMPSWTRTNRENNQQGALAYTLLNGVGGMVSSFDYSSSDEAVFLRYGLSAREQHTARRSPERELGKVSCSEDAEHSRGNPASVCYDNRIQTVLPCDRFHLSGGAKHPRPCPRTKLTTSVSLGYLSNVEVEGPVCCSTRYRGSDSTHLFRR